MSRGEFIVAATAEGVPIAPERYSAIGRRGRMLHQSPIFASGLDICALAAGEPAPAGVPAPVRLPVTERLQDRLVTLPALTNASERDVRQCAAALRKVAAAGAAGYRRASSSSGRPRATVWPEMSEQSSSSSSSSS